MVTYRSLRILVLCGFLVVAHNTALKAYYLNMPASVVVGQPDFTSSLPNQGNGEKPSGNTLDHPGQAWVINGRLFIADGENERVLIYNSIPTTNNAIADLVVGQVNLDTSYYNHATPTANTLSRPSGIASDGEKLIILDRDNYRILIYNELPTENYPAADIVIGQINMTTHYWFGDSGINDSIGVSDTTLSSGATGIFYDTQSGKLIVSDTDNDRILIYNRLPTSNGAAADVVVGQPDFYHNNDNQGGGTAANTLNLSTGSNVCVFEDKLLIADRVNNRVLVFNQIPTANNASADVVIGQPDFTSNLVNQGGAAGPNTLYQPRGVSVDEQGKLLIVDGLNARILVFNSIPTENNASADLVIGQPDFESIGGSTTNKTFAQFIVHVAFYENKFFVTDNGNARVLIFENDDDNTAPSLVSAPSFGAINSEAIEVKIPASVIEIGAGLFQWQFRRNSSELGRIYTTITSIVDTSLSENTTYTYDARFIDKAGNVGSYGDSAVVLTHVGIPTNFVLREDNFGHVNLRVDTFLNDTIGLSGYYFENTNTGINSGWTNANAWVDTADLSSGNSYTYIVKYRNSEGVETESISESLAPKVFFLYQNYPNPFNSSTRISYSLASTSHVRIQIFDQLGRLVITLVDEQQLGGNYNTLWNGENSSAMNEPSGIYFIRMNAGQFIRTSKMILVK